MIFLFKREYMCFMYMFKARNFDIKEFFPFIKINYHTFEIFFLQILALRSWGYINPGSGGYIHSDSDDHHNGGPMSLDPQWHIKEPWRC